MKEFYQNYSKKIGILITNLGTPDNPDKKSLRRYLKQFLSDRRVVDYNPILWKIILYGIILNIRPKRSAKLYKSIWTDHGSPLLNNMNDIVHGLNSMFEDENIMI